MQPCDRGGCLPIFFLRSSSPLLTSNGVVSLADIAFALAEWMEPVRVALVGRVLSAVAGVALVALVYRVGARAFGRTTGLSSCKARTPE